MTALIDTNVLVRHLTGDPPEQAAKASAFLGETDEIVLLDVIVAEVVYVLESVYDVERTQLAALVRAIVAFPPIVVVDEALLMRALEVYEVDRLDFAEAYLVAAAESAGLTEIASFDRSLDRAVTIERLEPGRIDEVN